MIQTTRVLYEQTVVIMNWNIISFQQEHDRSRRIQILSDNQRCLILIIDLRVQLFVSLII